MTKTKVTLYTLIIAEIVYDDKIVGHGSINIYHWADSLKAEYTFWYVLSFNL